MSANRLPVRLRRHGFPGIQRLENGNHYLQSRILTFFDGRLVIGIRQTIVLPFLEDLLAALVLALADYFLESCCLDLPSVLTDSADSNAARVAP